MTTVVPASLDQARRVLRDVFGYPDFRPGQEEIITSVLAGRDTLAVMPTGGGKSMCFQLPALLFESGVTLVVSPLLALMKDQVDALSQAGVPAAAVNSTISRDEQMEIMRGAATGHIRLLYVAPERFGDAGFMSLLRQVRVNLLAIDEAHCISQWGHDFRPSYRELGNVRPRLGDPPIIALTATADAVVRNDVAERLQLREPRVLVAGFDRPNLFFEVVRVRNQQEKVDHIIERIRELGDESVIVYCATRKKVESVTDTLARRGIRCGRYHAGMEDEDRKRVQNGFARDRVRVIVATNAFGMGIDKPDVRAVIHHDMPESMESYYQEAGRGGRDGQEARCTLLYTPRDRGVREFFIDLSHPDPEMVLDVYRRLVDAGGRVPVRDLFEGEDRPGVNAAVQALADSGLAQRQGYRAWALRAGAEGEIDTAGLEAHRAHAIRKLDSMQWYAESKSCLRSRILEYFGEDDAPAACGNCGPCKDGVRPMASTAAAPSGRLFEDLRILRRAFAERENVPPYAIFSDATLREMAEAQPLSRVQFLGISGVGVAKWDKYGEAFLTVVRHAVGRAGPPAAAEPPEDAALFEQMRTLRRRIAERDGVPPYVVFTDATLRDMARLRPRNRTQMLAVNGVGPLKWERYGEAFLGIITAAPAPEGAVAAPAVRAPNRALRERTAQRLADEPLQTLDGAALTGSVRRTFELHKRGLDLDGIARECGFTRDTIASHVATLIAAGLVDDISPWVDNALVNRIREHTDGGRVGALNPLKTALGDGVTYEQLRIARAYLNRK